MGARGSAVGARRSTPHSMMDWLSRKNLKFPFNWGDLASISHFGFVYASIFLHQIDSFRTVVKMKNLKNPLV